MDSSITLRCPICCAYVNADTQSVVEVEVAFAVAEEEVATCTSLYHEACLEQLTEEEVVQAAERHVRSAIAMQQWMATNPNLSRNNATLN